MLRVFKTRPFDRWARKVGLRNEALCEAVVEMIKGLIDADLGSGVLKKRVALPGRGKRGSTRTLVATDKGDRWFFLFGFEKNERGNLDAQELGALQSAASDLLKFSGEELDHAVDQGMLLEICHGSEA